MIAALLLATAAPMTPVEAERAFAADAQTLGQWTAFRKWAAPDAIMFVPQQIRAHDFLQPLNDPPKSVEWWPTASFVSCDGTVAVNTGGARWPDGRNSYFSTLWQRQANNEWRWRLDHGDDLKIARPQPKRTKNIIRRANCGGKPPSIIVVPSHLGRTGGGQSPDRTLSWFYFVDTRTGGRSFSASLWNGTDYEQVVSDRVGTFTTPQDLIKRK